MYFAFATSTSLLVGACTHGCITAVQENPLPFRISVSIFGRQLIGVNYFSRAYYVNAKYL